MPAAVPTDVTADDLGTPGPGRDHAACVTLAFQAERPLDAPVRFSLAGIDGVWFSRGRDAPRSLK